MNEARQITAISFDGDATLWDFERVMRHSLSITLEELRRHVRGGAVAEFTVDTMIDIRNAVANELKGRTVNLEEVRLQAFKRTLEFVGCATDSLAANLNALYLKHRFEDIELYPDVIDVLDFLASRFTLGLISNGNGYPERCGLPDRFSFVVFSQDVGVEKPNPAIFATACSKAGCTPAELLHVGDSLKTDVAGANSFGAVSVWLNRNCIENSTDIKPDYEIQSLTDLVGIVRKHGEASNNPVGGDA